jgi:hypothetical protein
MQAAKFGHDNELATKFIARCFYFMAKFVSEKNWVRQILQEYDAIEKRQPKILDSIIDEWPKWVVNLWPILFGVSHPGLKFKRVKRWTAKDLGQFLGRQSALEGLAWNEVPLSPRVSEEKEQWIASQAAKLESDPKLAKVPEKYALGLEKWRPLFKKFIDEALASARNRPYPESSAFLEAFGKAVVIKPDELATERTMGVGERIAYVMIIFWRPISKFESIAQLHKFLSAAAKPMGIVITLKRIEKLCQRIGLKFKQGRGRPKAKIQTISPATS